MANLQKYDHTQVEEKWLSKWEEERLFWGAGHPGDERSDSIGSGRDSENDTTPSNSPLQMGRMADKLYLLFAFAYPSGSGLHVGHVESKTALDILARYYRMMGRQVFFPVGWDAFGLPAENYAIKTGVPPVETTKQAIDTFRRQIKRLGISYNWDTELATCHPGYYKWTQWLFLEFYENGLAYKKPGMVNWCPSCQTVLANEQVIQKSQLTRSKKQTSNKSQETSDQNDSNLSLQETVGVCERCETPVEQKEMEQWYFRITDYVEELITGLDQVNWPEATKKQQLEWIGKAKGLNIDFLLKGTNLKLTVWTKFWETVFGTTYLVIAPEKFNKMELIDYVPDEKKALVNEYLKKASHKTEEERKIGEKEKTGVDTGLQVINPVNGDSVPLYVADYVLTNVGTGVVMGVPAHDERDFAFAKKYSLDIVQVVEYEDQAVNEAVAAGLKSFEGEGKLVHSGEFDGLSAWGEGKEKMAAWMIEKGVAEWNTTYKLRDWLISRQRYWGAPIPIVYDPDGVPHPVKREHLPWMLPTDVDYRPKGTSPLGTSKELFARVEKLYGEGWTPEIDTMDTFVDSSWYFLRYPSVGVQKSIFRNSNIEYRDTKQSQNSNDQNLKKESVANISDLDIGISSLSQAELEILGWDRDWSRDTSLPFDLQVTSMMLPVDFYMIGPEHIVLHLLYSRFLTKFLRDKGYLQFDEPFMKMRHQGMILGPDHKKMSKSKGNVITPDEIVEEFGADTLRMYEMFMGPLDADKPWDPRAVAGVNRFLQRYYRYVMGVIEQDLSTTKRPTEALPARDDTLDLNSVSSVSSVSDVMRRLVHRTLMKVSGDIPQLKFNTAIAAMMEMLNGLEEGLKDGKVVGEGEVEILIKMVAPMAPYVSEELWQALHQMTDDGLLIKDEEQESKIDDPKSKISNEIVSIHLTQWPEWDPQMVESGEVTLVVQVNGKTRSKLKVQSSEFKAEMSQEDILGLVEANPGVNKWLEGKDVKKMIYIPPKNNGSGLINVVV